jgi:Zn-dependent M28 family amino/carboxypeptidase
VAALIELARFYSTLKNNNYTILFIAFNAEELGLIGSTYLAEKIDKKKIKLVINIEMLGRSKSQKANQPFITGNRKKNLLKN